MADMRLILIAGIPRSGSTWLFNVARALLLNEFGRVNSSWVDDFKSMNETEAQLVKIHEPDEFWDSQDTIVISGHRDLRDVAASAAAMGWVSTQEEMVTFASKGRFYHDFWSTRATLDVGYQQLHAQPISVAREIANAIGLSATGQDLERALADVPQSVTELDHRNHDKTTLLHEGHITDGRPGRWQGQLSESTAEKIWLGHRNWFLKNGYSK